jgi:hypothetical protein
MLSINLPEPTFRRMELIAEPRQEKGSPSWGPHVNSWIELSDPQHIRLAQNPVGEDSELEQFLAADQGRFRYDYVRLACTFCPENDERFEKAWVTVTLKAESASPQSVPISWSIFPLAEYDNVEETVGTKFGSSAKILSAEVSASSKVATKLYNLRGFREGKSNPYWELYSNNANSLNGVLRFHLVVRSAQDSPTLGEVRLEAVISNRMFVVFREKRAFDQTPSSEFRLPPA